MPKQQCTSCYQARNIIEFTKSFIFLIFFTAELAVCTVCLKGVTARRGLPSGTPGRNWEDMNNRRSPLITFRDMIQGKKTVRAWCCDGLICGTLRRKIVKCEEQTSGNLGQRIGEGTMRIRTHNNDTRKGLLANGTLAST